MLPMHQQMLMYRILQQSIPMIYTYEENESIYFHFALSEMVSVAVMSSGLSRESAFHFSGNVFSYLISKEARLISNPMDFLSLLSKNISHCAFLLCPWLAVLSLYSHTPYTDYR